MPAAERRITAADIIPDAAFAAERKARRAALLPVKRLRRIALGPWCTVYFESFETMLFQVQEMLLIEKGGEAQLADELAAYNPMIPQGAELAATVMFEIDDPARRARVLAELGGVEDHFFLEVGGDARRRRAGGRHRAHPRGRQDLVGALPALPADRRRRPPRSAPRPPACWSAATTRATPTSPCSPTRPARNWRRTWRRLLRRRNAGALGAEGAWMFTSTLLDVWNPFENIRTPMIATTTTRPRR